MRIRTCFLCSSCTYSRNFAKNDAQEPKMQVKFSHNSADSKKCGNNYANGLFLKEKSRFDSFIWSLKFTKKIRSCFNKKATLPYHDLKKGRFVFKHKPFFSKFEKCKGFG
jgi:hypothetical protein